MDNDFNRRITKYYEHNKSDFVIDDITYNDLNLDSVYNKINKTVSSLGDEILYYLLRTPKTDVESVNEFEKNIEYYKADKANADSLKKKLTKLSKLKRISVFEYLYALNDVPNISNFTLILPFVLFVIAIAGFFINATIGILLLVLAFGINTVNYFKLNKDIEPYVACFAYIIRAIKTAEQIGEIKKEEYSNFSSIKRCSFVMGNMTGTTAHGGLGSPLDLVFDLLKMAFHFDIMKFYSMLNIVKENSDGINEMLFHLGMIDVYLSVIELRDELTVYSIPKFTNNLIYKADNLYHPLLSNPVSNSIDTKKGVLLTGSNASGKSTFLRSVMINAILSQAINTSLSQNYEAPMFIITSCMSISDSVTMGDSFYMAEIKAMKRIMDLSDNTSAYIITALDEILKGTNTIERIAAGCEILKYLSKDNVLCFAATHDMELTKLLEGEYSNYHFSEDMNEDDIKFSYKLKEGPSKTTNAIKLLKLLNYNDTITNNALYRVEKYKENNSW